MSELTVTSEIYAENNFSTRPSEFNNYVLSEFPFHYKPNNKSATLDEDEYSQSTSLKLVGLQVWRGAFLLADLVLHYGADLTGQCRFLSAGSVLELGAGAGLTGIVAGMKFDRVICTDINIGGILELIERNIKRNQKHLKGDVCTMELDFKANSWSHELMEQLQSVNLILAADVVYDNDLTEAFVKTIERLLSIPPQKTIYIALEKRYVFTLADLDSVAPCYEHFLSCLQNAIHRNIENHWDVTQLDIDFPKYFEYERCKELVLWKITSKNFVE